MNLRAKNLIATLSGIGALAFGATSAAAHQGHGMSAIGPGMMMAQSEETGEDAARQSPSPGSGQGPGMMQGMRQGYGPGQGMMGQGMGQGYGPGPGMMMGRGMMGPGMMGQGYGPGPGMMGQGYGPGMMSQGYGPGPGMMGQGYGPGGPGMMSPGMGYGPGPGMMMGQGMGYGMGPGMMMGPGHGYGPHMGHGPHMGMGYGMGYGPCWQQQGAAVDKELEPGDVRARLERWLEMQGNDRLKLGTVEAADDDTITAEIVTVDDSLVQKLAVDRHTGWTRPTQ